MGKRGNSYFSKQNPFAFYRKYGIIIIVRSAISWSGTSESAINHAKKRVK